MDFIIGLGYFALYLLVGWMFIKAKISMRGTESDDAFTFAIWPISFVLRLLFTIFCWVWKE